MSYQIPVAIVVLLVLSFAPNLYEYSLENRETADFEALSEKLQKVRFAPDGWKSNAGEFDLSDEWIERLGIHDHRAENVVDDQGRQFHVLVMLSESGEQLIHTPDVCYAAVGCEVRGEVVRLPVGDDNGDIRAVQVIFDRLTGGDSRVVAFGYWSESEWTSPPPATILNQMSRDPYLLKIQILADHDQPDDAEFRKDLDQYLAFLSGQLRELGL